MATKYPETPQAKGLQPPSDSERRSTMSEDIPAPPKVEDFYPDQIVIYGIKLNASGTSIELPFADKRLKLEVYKNNEANELLDHNKIAMVVAYGYGFEGHCYRLDRPKLFVFELIRKNISEGPAKGCGFDGLDYMMWRISSKRVLLEFSMSVDLAEMLILEANLPGNQVPNTYGNKMQLAHRGGRLNRGGASS
jgi:hypothetical protein